MTCQEVNLCSKGKIQWVVDSNRLNVKEQDREREKKVNNHFFSNTSELELGSWRVRLIDDQGVEGTLRENKPTVET